MSTYCSYGAGILMVLAFVSVYWQRRFYSLPVWLWLLGAALICALPGKIIAPVALLWVLLALLFFYFLHKKPRLQPWLLTLLAIYLFALGLGVLPGFTRTTLIDPALLGAGQVPYGLRMGLAKPIAGLLILAWLAPRCANLRELFLVFRSWQLWFLPVLLVLLSVWALGLAIDIKYVWWTPLFILVNAFLTALPEEAFFRTFLQQPIQTRFGKAWWIIPLMGLLFACAHMVPTSLGVWRFFVAIWLAGMAYAWSFRQAGRIEAAWLTHVSVNALHFVFLTYPMAF